MADSPTIERVTALVSPILADLGLDLYDIDFGAGLLKITVDKPGGVNLEAIALATRLINREFDHSDPVPGKYTLEVSSPGIERPLRRPDHYTRIIGATVNVRLRDVTNESRRVQGVLIAADDHGIVVRSDEAPHDDRSIPYDRIDRARTVFVWQEPAKGAAPKKSPAAKKPNTPNKPDTPSMEVSA
ncbi:MAG: ribosome maturation factor RimP [Actinomycetota bacterium]|jgi:ribosome maturation factor RimP